MADEQLFDLSKYNGDFSSILTHGGIPVTDINILNDPNKTTDRKNGFNITPNSFGTRSADAARRVIYGRVRTGGTLMFYTTDQGGTGAYLHIAFALAGHEIDAVEKLYIEEEEVQFGGGGFFSDPRWGLVNTKWQDKVFMSVSTGADDQLANADLVSQSAANFPGLWTVEHRGRGIAYVYLILVYDKELYPTSVPKVSFLVRGKKVYDPRNGLTQWTQNAPLCIADYIASQRYGAKSSYSRIHSSTLIEAANTADENVGLNGGGNEKRYTMNGVFETSLSRSQVLQAMQPCIGMGSITRISSTWYIRPQKWRAPSITIDENDVRGGLGVRCKVSRRDNFNGVKGTFISAEQNYTEVDFPAQTSSFYLAQDGGREKFADVSFPLITSNATSQRVGKIILEKARQPIQVDGVFSLRCYTLIPGDTLAFNYARYGWVNKPFEVITCRLDADSNGALGVAMSLRETAEGVSDWNNGAETLVDLAPDTYLPSPSQVQAIESLTVASGTAQLLRNGDGTIITRAQLTWPVSTDPFKDSIEIEFKKSADSDWQRAPSVDSQSTTAFIANVQDGVEYDFRVRVKNASGYASAWTTFLAHLVVGKTEPPSDVINFTAVALADGIFTSWNQISDVDRADYVLKVGDAFSTWDTAAQVEEQIKGTSYKFRTQAAGTYKFFIKARDTSGNVSFLPSGTTIVIPGPGVTAASVAFSQESVIFSFPAVSSFFAIDHYELSYGSTYASSTLVSSANSTVLSVPAAWSGYRQFYLVAVDQGGNRSTPQVIPVLLQAPGAVTSIIPDKIGHFVTLRWTPPSTGTLSVAKYRVLRGANFGTAELVGEFNGTFVTIFETVGGTFTYWIQPVDLAGNLGTQEFVTVTLSAPSDFVLKADQTITDFTVKNNVFLDPAGFFIGPFNPSESWEAHFVNRGWTTIAQQLDAGFNFYAEPGATDGYVETVIDFGVAFPSTALLLDFDSQVLDGALTFEPKLSWSADNVTFTAPVSGASALATSCRYVKIRIDFNGTTNRSLGFIKNVRLRASVKLETDQGMVTANSGDSGGTTVNFNLPFLDIESITVSVSSTSDDKAVYDFVDAPNPTSMKVLAFNGAGSRVTKTVSWVARGVVA